MKKLTLIEDLTLNQIIKEIVIWETNCGRKAKVVKVLSIEYDHDADMYTYEEDVTEAECWYQQFHAVVSIDGVVSRKLYEWSCDENNICTSMDDNEYE